MDHPDDPTTFPAMRSGNVVMVRVSGPGTCRESGRFESVLLDVEQRGFQTLILDLGGCSRIDSTFAGALLRLAARAARFREAGLSRRVVLAGAQDQVAELLDTLCLTDQLESVSLPETAGFAPLPVDDRDLPREQILALSLDGHERLAALNDANARRFANLLPLLRAELAKDRNDIPPAT